MSPLSNCVTVDQAKRSYSYHRQPKREMRGNNVNATYANVLTLALERCCVTKMRF